MVHHAATVLAITGTFTIASIVLGQNPNPLCLLNATLLTSSIHPADNIVQVCPGEDVHFNCAIIQSSINAPIIWSVIVAPGDVDETPLRLYDVNMMDTFNGYVNIKAVLNRRNSCGNDTYYVLESKLSITNYNYSTTKITCSGENVDAGNSKSLTVQLIEKFNPNTSQYAIYYYNQALDQHECRLYLFWHSLNNASGNPTEFMLYENGQSLFNETIGNNTVTEISYNCSCESEVTNNLTIRSINNQCIEIPITKFTRPEYLEEPIPSQSCPPPNSTDQTFDTPNGASNPDNTLIICIAVPTSTVTVIVIAIIIVVSIIVVLRVKKTYTVNKQHTGKR